VKSDADRQRQPARSAEQHENGETEFPEKHDPRHHFGKHIRYRQLRDGKPRQRQIAEDVVEAVPLEPISAGEFVKAVHEVNEDQLNEQEPQRPRPNMHGSVAWLPTALHHTIDRPDRPARRQYQVKQNDAANSVAGVIDVGIDVRERQRKRPGQNDRAACAAAEH
jgi:hypothetical protein